MQDKVSFYAWVFLLLSMLVATTSTFQFFCNTYSAIAYVASEGSFLDDVGLTHELYGVITGPVFLVALGVSVFSHVSSK